MIIEKKELYKVTYYFVRLSSDKPAENYTDIALYHMLHNEGGPAIQWDDGDYCWADSGNYHRVNGPACYLDGSYHWWYKGRLASEEFYAWLDEVGIDKDKETTENEANLIRIRWPNGFTV